VSARIDLIAAAWGGLACAVAMMAGSARDLPVRVAIVAVGFYIGGFLSGVRATTRRMLHGVAAWALGYGLYAVFLVLTAALDLVGGPDRPDAFTGGAAQAASVALIGLAGALAGGASADSWLRPKSRDRDKRRRERQRS
jgi:hypothetical protein